MGCTAYHMQIKGTGTRDYIYFFFLFKIHMVPEPRIELGSALQQHDALPVGYVATLVGYVATLTLFLPFRKLYSVNQQTGGHLFSP